MSKLLSILLFFPLLGIAQHHCGYVTKVMDGDSFMLQLTDTPGLVKVRVHGVDCPELKQDYGLTAKLFVKSELADKKVCIDITGWDAYNAAFCIIHYDGKLLQKEILAAGLGWHQKKYYPNQDCAKAQQYAWRTKTGLWQENKPTPPWTFRQSKTTKPN